MKQLDLLELVQDIRLSESARDAKVVFRYNWGLPDWDGIPELSYVVSYYSPNDNTFYVELEDPAIGGESGSNNKKDNKSGQSDSNLDAGSSSLVPATAA